MTKSLHFALMMLMLAHAGQSQQKFDLDISELQSPTQELLIGLHLLDENVYWASGTGATVIRSLDGGNTWKKLRYTADTTLQFRDIHAFDSTSALVMAAGTGEKSAIFRVNFNNNQWQKVYAMPHRTGFLDAISFWDQQHGIAYGDAINNSLFILTTSDGGTTWSETSSENLPPAGVGEGGFASSGTNISVLQGGSAYIGTGAGGNARLLYSSDYGHTWIARTTPMVKGETAGITSVRFISNEKGLIAGGDLAVTEKHTHNIFTTADSGNTWKALSKPIFFGPIYGSAFCRVNGKEIYMITGPAGADISFDDGKTWRSLTKYNLWSCDLLSSGIGLLIGKGGNIMKVNVR